VAIETTQGVNLLRLLLLPPLVAAAIETSIVKANLLDMMTSVTGAPAVIEVANMTATMNAIEAPPESGTVTAI
jgi:hypothetical protein